MANPQTENGFTSISNELLEALARTRFAGLDRQIFDYIMRQTYGWKRKEAPISLEQFVEGTGLCKTRVCESIRNLKVRNIITEKRNRQPHLYGIQKNYTIWSQITEIRNKRKQATTRQRDTPIDYGNPESSKITEIRNLALKGITEIRNNSQPIAIEERHLQSPKESTTTAKKETSTPTVGLDDPQDNHKLQNAKRILTYWNGKDIIVHRSGYVQKIQSPVNAKLTEGHTLEDIEGAIDNYHRILISTEHWFSYNWTLDHFLQRGFEKFRVQKVADANYRTKAIPRGEDEGWSPKEEER